MKNGLKVSAVIPAKPAEIYKAWLSSKGHSAMTGSAAKVTGKVGGKFTAWDGYIFGKTLELELVTASFKPGGRLNSPTMRPTPGWKFYWQKSKLGQK